MTKSKLFGIKSRRAGALERLREIFRVTDVALSASTDVGKKKLAIKQKRVQKEITNLENKKNYSRKNK